MLLTFDKQQDLIQTIGADRSDTAYSIARGIQRCKRWTAFPLRPLTFLYGPNSSGKGIVGDVQSIFSSLCYRRTRSGLRGGLSEVPLARFDEWRRSEPDTKPSIGFSATCSLVELFHIDPEHYWPVHEWPSFLNRLFDAPRDIDPQRMTWVVTWTGDEGDDPSMALYWMDRRVASLRCEADCAELYANMESLENLLKVKLRGEDMFANVATSAQTFAPDEQLVGRFDEWDWWLGDLPAYQSSTLSADNAREAIALVVHLFGCVRLLVANRSSYIGPLRYMPQGESLRFRFRVDDHWHAWNPDWERVIGTTGDGRGAWSALAMMLAQDAATQIRTLGQSENIPLSGAQVLERINRWLNAKEYFGTDVCLGSRTQIGIRLPDVLERKSMEQVTPSGYEDIAVELILSDHTGRMLALEDVGAGFSQLIPVLVALLEQSPQLETVGLVLIEQPELHLHPRMQGAIGDVLLEVVNARWGRDASLARAHIVVESHSEHMLLRVLRRLRNASHGAPMLRDPQPGPEDIAVVYFEPEGDESFAHWIRIGNDGRFLDRWPRGFFEDRFEDLFDE